MQANVHCEITPSGFVDVHSQVDLWSLQDVLVSQAFADLQDCEGIVDRIVTIRVTHIYPLLTIA